MAALARLARPGKRQPQSASPAATGRRPRRSSKPTSRRWAPQVARLARPVAVVPRSGSDRRSGDSRTRRGSTAGRRRPSSTSGGRAGPPRPPADRRRWPPPSCRPARPRCARQVAASWRTSLLRSSWSRLRLSSATARGAVAATTRPSQASSTSRAAGRVRRGRRPGRRPARAAGWRPRTLVTTGPAVARAAAQQAGGGGLAVGPRHQSRPGGRPPGGAGRRDRPPGWPGRRPPTRRPDPSRRDRPETAPPMPAASRVRAGSGPRRGEERL